MFKQTILTLTCVAAASSGFAQSANTSTATLGAASTVTAENPKGLVPMIGIGAGYMDRNEDTNSEGVPSNAKILGSYYFFETPAVADLGVGMMNQNFSRSEQDGNITGAVLEAAARYKFNNKLQVGAVANSFMDNSDRYGSSDSQHTLFGGVQVARDFALNSNTLLRVGGRLMTDLNISGETVNVGMLDVALGWVPSRQSSTAQTTAVPARATAATPNPEVTHLVKSEELTYGVDQAQLPVQRAQSLQSLSKMLAENPELFERVEVVGHADQTGTEQHNLTLSQNRADGVASTLARAGLQKEKMATFAKGEEEPLIDSLQPEALQQNRRVELRFFGVKDRAALEKALSNLR